MLTSTQTNPGEDHARPRTSLTPGSTMVKKPELTGCPSQRFVLYIILGVAITVFLYISYEGISLQERSISNGDHETREAIKALPCDSVTHLPKKEKSLHQKVVETNYSTIWMGPPEVNMVLRYIHNRETYLEWGSGGSTMNFPRWVPKAVSIEHDAEWCTAMKERIAEDGNLDHVDYRCVPVAQGTAGWGKNSKFEEGNYRAFRDYVNEIDNVGGLFDFILIDGRARVDCAIKALSYIKNDSVVVLHDSSRVWTANGGTGKYGDVKEWYTFLNFVGGLNKQGVAILKRKPEFAKYQGDHDAVRHLLEQRYS